MTSAQTLIRLLHFRWTVPALAAFAECRGQAKFVTLQRKLGVGRSSLQRTLASLIEAGLVRRNEGYGHPMRPEYLLTDSGRRVAAASAGLMAQLQRLGIQDLALRKWSLPVVHVVERAGGRFNRLRYLLGEITPRALAQALADLQAAGLVERELVDGRPPRAEYRLTDDGRRVTELAIALGVSS